MKWKKGMMLGLALAMAILVPQHSSMRAADFEGNEEAWLNKCSVAQESEAAAKQCAAFKEYYAKVSNQLEHEVSSLDKQIAKVKSNIDEITSAMKQLQVVIDKLDKSIKINEANIRTINGQIKILNGEIKQKQKDIDKRNAIIMAVSYTHLDVYKRQRL